MPIDRVHDPLEGIRPDGTIATGAHFDNLSVAFRPVLDKAGAGLRAMGSAYSLYVYGSVATGQARVGSSDVDLVTIGLDAALARGLAAELTADYAALCRGVEIGVAQPADYAGPGDEAYGNRVFLRHYCVHLAGPDLRARLPDYAGDRAAACGFNGDIGLQANRWRSEAAGGVELSRLARRIARKTLHAVAGLVSVNDGTWTTDRGAAARRFGVSRPGLAAQLDTLVAWGSGDTASTSRSALFDALDGVVAEVVAAFADRIGLWALKQPASGA